MARPKRHRTEVASIELPPTTRRRRSSNIEAEPPAIGVGGKGDSHKKSTTTSTNNTGSSTTKSSSSNENTKSTMKIHEDNNSNKIPASKKSATVLSSTTDGDVDDAPVPKTTRLQPSISSSATTGSTTTATNNVNNSNTHNDLGNDHANNDDDDAKNTSLVDTNSRTEVPAAPVISDTTTDDSVPTTKRILSSMNKNNNNPSSSTSKVVHSTSTNTVAVSTTSTSTGSNATIPRSVSVTTTRRSSHLNNVSDIVATEMAPVETSSASTTLEATMTDAINAKEKSLRKENAFEASPLTSTTYEQIEIEQATTTTEPKRSRIRKDDIVSLLQHRKMLLQRIRQCRKVTEQRLSTAAVKSIDEEKETVIFTDTMKQALSLARKQARLEQQRDGNNNKTTGSNSNINNSAGNITATTVSLRRGNSVGKRMNAAISTLTGTSTSNSNQQQQQHVSSGVVPLKLASLMTATNDSMNPLSESVSVSGEMSGPTLPSTKTNQNKNLSSTAVGGTVQSLKSANKRSDSSMSRTIPKKSQNSKGNADNHSAHNQQQQRQRINVTSDGGILNNHRPYTSTNSMTGIHHRPSRVVCPETMALRNRRDDVRNMLSLLLKSRLHPKFYKVASLSERRNSLVSHVSSSSLSPRSTVITSKPITTSLHRTSRHGSRDKSNQKLSSTSAVPIWESPGDPPICPPRRKTHWDTVLEEMRWMATDFIEEQKWKYATSRVLSVQVSTFVSSSTKKCPPKNSHATQLVADSSEITRTSDVQNVDKHCINSIQKDSRATGTSLLSAVAFSNFQPITRDDILSVRKIAKHISDVVSDMGQLNKVLSGPSIAIAPTVDTSNQSNAITDEYGTTEPSLDFLKEKADFIQRVSTHVDRISKSTTEQLSITHEENKSTEDKSNANIIQPSVEQIRTINMIEDRWQRSGIGSVLHGPRASGKTIVACCLLHRNRSKGPQLLVCSSASLIRWLHELSSFNGLHIKQWNHADSSADLLKSFGANDVLICKRSWMTNINLKDLSKFTTIILDCRYAKQSNQLHLTGISTEQSICVPDDISSHKWWKRIVDVVLTGDIGCRLLVDSFASDGTLTYLRGLTSRQFLVVTALRTAFLVGPKWFVTPIYPFEKAVLAWARRRTKLRAAVGSKFTQVSSVLSKLCSICHFLTGTETDNFEWLGKVISCDVQYCAMTQTQRYAYDRACQQSRLLLSKELDNNNEKGLEDIAACLILLRRHCIHSDIDTILRQANINNQTNKYQTAAQPDIDFSHRILSGSGKLRQLVSILLHNKGYNLFGLFDNKSAGQQQTNNSNICVSNPIEQKGKIAIIASLPEVQLLVSCLLHSLGIHHEILMTHTSTLSMQHHRYNEDSLSWLKVQTLLSTFNDHKDSNLHIVVTSLLTIEGDHVGLGIEAADTIVLLDENWSGQDERLLHSVISRCSLKRKVTGRSDAQIIRLVTECTCEETFLRNDTGILCHGDSLTSWAKRLNTTDLLQSSEENKINGSAASKQNGQHDSPFLLFCFPSQNIFRHRNKTLDAVLRPSRTLSRLAPHSLHHHFLPVSHDIESSNIDTNFTSYLVHKEDLTRVYRDHIGVLPPIVLEEVQAWNGVSDCQPPPLLQNFVRRQNEAMASQENGSMLPLTNVTLAAKGITHAAEATDHIERETRQTLSKPPGDVAISVLLYGQDNMATNSKISRPGNRYAESFSTISTGALRHDGNQGSEALVYFPPIFPKLRECYDSASFDLDMMRQHQAPHEESVTDKSVHSPSVQNRGRGSGAESIDFDVDFGLAGIGVFPSFHDSVTSASCAVAQSGTPCAESNSLNIWLSSISPLNAEEYQKSSQRQFTDMSIKSVILMVSRKRQRGQSNISFQARYGAGLWNGISSSISDTSFSVDVNGVNKKGKKAVSAFNRLPLADTPQHARPTMFTFQRKDDYRHRLLSTLRQSSTSSGSTIFEAPIFRVAAVRVREKILDRLQNQTWTTSSTRVNDKSRSGLPIASRSLHEVESNSWTSIVSRCQKSAEILNEQTNDRARQQTISFQKSQSEPRRVDFGPFHLGFVSSMSGMSSVTYPRARIGIALPMGVKISISSKEQTAVQWSNEMDRILTFTINRFGTNWILASLILKSFFGMSYLHKESNFYRFQWAPRFCRDRWRLLSRDEDSSKCYDTTFDAQAEHVGGNVGSRKMVSNQYDVESKTKIFEREFLVPTLIDSIVPSRSRKETPVHNESLPTQHKSSRRKFTSFQLGSAKQKHMPIAIAGVASVISPCHPSHELTVQMSTMAVNGRTDMWPLQILDGAERLRSAAAASSVVVESSSSNGVSVPTRRPVSMSSRPHNSNTSGRNVVPSSHRSQSTASQVPVQRTTSSSGTSGSQRPASQHAYPTNHVTASKQRFVPPVPPTKVTSTPKVQLPSANTTHPPQAIASQPSKSLNTTNNLTSQPPMVAAKPTGTAHIGTATIPSTKSNNSIITDKATATPTSTNQIQSSKRAESDVTIPSVSVPTINVPVAAAPQVPEKVAVDKVATENLQPTDVPPSIDSNVVAPATGTATESSKPVAQTTEPTPSAEPHTTPLVPNKSASAKE